MSRILLIVTVFALLPMGDGCFAPPNFIDCTKIPRQYDDLYQDCMNSLDRPGTRMVRYRPYGGPAFKLTAMQEAVL